MSTNGQEELLKALTKPVTIRCCVCQKEIETITQLEFASRLADSKEALLTAQTRRCQDCDRAEIRRRLKCL